MSRELPFVIALCLLPVMAAAQKQPDVPRVAQEVVAGINRERERAGAKPLAPEQRLGRVAQSFAEYLARTDRFDHDADGSEPGARMRKGGYAWCAFAENIAYEFRSSGFESADLAKLFVRDWLESSGHRRNLLNPEMKHTGVGIAQSASSKRWYAVQVFGKPCATSAR